MTKASLVRRFPRSLVRDPFFRDMDRLFSEQILGPMNLFNRWAEEGLRDTWVPPVDVQETETSLLFTAELPGLSKDDIEITIEDNVLTVSGERKFNEKTEGENYHRIERAYGKFSRSFSLPAQVDSKKVSATFQEGLLRLEVPKTEAAKPHKIEIR